MGVAEELQTAQGLLASGDVQSLLRFLRADGEALPLGEVARLVAGAARLAGFDDLAQAAAAAAEGGDGSGTADARALYDFGYACIERGAGYLAVRPLARALELAPDARAGAQRAGGGPRAGRAARPDRRGAPGARAGAGSGCTGSSTSTTR